jgi:hypothetical protein
MEQALRQLLRPTIATGVPIRTLTFGNAGDAWPFSPDPLRSAAYPDENADYWTKRIGFDPSKVDGSK